MDLRLPLRGNWFDLTKKEVKKEDYREITPYWAKRLIYNLTDVLVSNNRNGVGNFIDEKDAYDFLTNPRNNFGFKDFEKNIMTLGYPEKGDFNRMIFLKHKGIIIREGKPEWGAELNKQYFVILHGELIS